MRQNEQMQAHLEKQGEIEGRLVEKVEQLREMRSAFRDLLAMVLTVASSHLGLPKSELVDLKDFQKVTH